MEHQENQMSSRIEKPDYSIEKFHKYIDDNFSWEKFTEKGYLNLYRLRNENVQNKHWFEVFKKEWDKAKEHRIENSKKVWEMIAKNEKRFEKLFSIIDLKDKRIEEKDKIIQEQLEVTKEQNWILDEVSESLKAKNETISWQSEMLEKQNNLLSEMEITLKEQGDAIEEKINPSFSEN